MECMVQGIIETRGLCGVSKKKLRVLCLKSGPNLGSIICDIEQTEPTCSIRQIGGAMRGAGAEQLSVLVRSVVESKTRKNVLRFFYALGYNLDHELLRVGFSFHFQKGTQIITAPATSENYTDVVAAVSSFCEYLASLLHLSKPGISTGVVPTAAAAAASLYQMVGVRPYK
ncbi:mediator of RNA polymerase II transcription subunit 18 [Pyrus ussuriensis x Pyrus communis]|uniref:Mediator of RNA polymerase II transcription subunit 18 n=1 Tax=Pyrus ussuriensis x Pyrus communis TaxID=2448454 RepID=A0A5N5HMB4_9ROSA|nr:mediator of RNA polymerase II transcription subunit 18 [Pyrus ussuriensis x Pyrus communis]